MRRAKASTSYRSPRVGDVYLWHTGHRVVVTAVEGAMSYVRWCGQTTGNMRMPVATGLLAAVAPVRACWSDNEVQALRRLYESGDKANLPWGDIPDRLNEEFGNGRTLAACQCKLYDWLNRGDGK